MLFSNTNTIPIIMSILKLHLSRMWAHALMMEAVGSPEMLAPIYQTTRYHTSQGRNLYAHRYDNLKTNMSIWFYPASTREFLDIESFRGPQGQAGETPEWIS